MRRKSKLESISEDTVEVPAEHQKCPHYWVLETPSGPVSRGKCKICGEEREFSNIFTASWYEDDDLFFIQQGAGSSVQLGAKDEE